LGCSRISAEDKSPENQTRGIHHLDEGESAIAKDTELHDEARSFVLAHTGLRVLHARVDPVLLEKPAHTRQIPADFGI